MTLYRVYLYKPIYVGFSVLELAKLHVYKTHYETFNLYYGNRIQLEYTDTDSFIYYIETENILADLQHFSSIMHFSEYPSYHPLYDVTNKKKLGYMKDEMCGQPITEFIGLKAKMYALKTADEEKKRAKGVQRSVLNQEITFEDFKQCLFEDGFMYHSMTRLNCENHKIRGIEQIKMSLSPFDDKRYIFPDKVHTLAHGHYRIKDL